MAMSVVMVMTSIIVGVVQFLAQRLDASRRGQEAVQGRVPARRMEGEVAPHHLVHMSSDVV